MKKTNLIETTRPYKTSLPDGLRSCLLSLISLKAIRILYLNCENHVYAEMIKDMI